MAEKEHNLRMMEVTTNHKMELANHEFKMRPLEEQNERLAAAEAERIRKENESCALM
jgi:hypothetical protein